MVECYPHEIQQILMNLIINAKHAVMKRNESDGKEKTIIIRSKEFMINDQNYVRLVVQDNGTRAFRMKLRKEFSARFLPQKADVRGPALGCQ